VTPRLVVRPVTLPDDLAAIERLLTGSRWPYHVAADLTPRDIASLDLVSDGTSSHLVLAGDDPDPIALIRLQDLDDIDETGSGCPLFDLRVADAHRGRGVGAHCVRWLTSHLFTTYPSLHRVEAQTRSDNLAMQAVLVRCGYVLEGRYREAWPASDGRRLDSCAYGILRSEWQANS
jgi:RimJ/RimL family protein N-acetyltransferase